MLTLLRRDQRAFCESADFVGGVLQVLSQPGSYTVDDISACMRQSPHNKQPLYNQACRWYDFYWFDLLSIDMQHDIVETILTSLVQEGEIEMMSHHRGGELVWLYSGIVLNV